MISTFISLFCGFTIIPSNFPSFWIFMYWLDPLHYALEGLVTTQFFKDNTPVTITGSTATLSASNFVEIFYPDWDYSHRGLDIMALFLFIIVLRYVGLLTCLYPHSSSNHNFCLIFETESAPTLRWSTCVTTNVKRGLD